MTANGQTANSIVSGHTDTKPVNTVCGQTASLKHEVHVQSEEWLSGEAQSSLTHRDEEVSKVVRTAPPDGGCPSAREEVSYVGVSIRWARAWFTEVDEARKALDRAERIAELRRARAFSIADPLGTEPHGKGGVSDPMRRVDEMIDGEAEDASYGWARDALALFDLMVSVNRPCFRGALLDGLDVAEMKYRLGAIDKEIMDAFHIGRSKLYDDLSALVEYLDFIGPEKTFHLDETRPAELPPSVDVPPEDVGAHCDAYGDIDALVANCGRARTESD